MLTQQEIYDAIRKWEMRAGESFLDYFDSDINGLTLMKWAWGRRYITVDQWNLFEQEIIDGLSTKLLSGMDILEGYECPYAITTDEEWEKGRMILAEFMSESIIYQKRLAKFLSEDESDEDDEEYE